MQRDEILKAEHEQNLKDAARLADLAEQLKQELEKNDRYILSVSSLKKTDEIEKLVKKSVLVCGAISLLARGVAAAQAAPAAQATPAAPAKSPASCWWTARTRCSGRPGRGTSAGR